MHNWSELILGNDLEVPTSGNIFRRYINFDNAASTPAFKKVTQDVTEYLGWYSNIHRGEGFKSRLCTNMYESCRQQVADYLGLDISTNTVIFVKNTTEAINKLVNYMSFKKKNIVISTFMEHHSNDLPWRKKAKVLYTRTCLDGTLDYDHVEQLLKKHAGKVRILTVTGASNVTGVVNDISRLAELAHQYGAEIMVDAAQLAPHKQINMLPDHDPRHIDYIAFSGHKMYAPFGVGVLAGKKSTFENSEPDYVGGGTISVVSHERVFWAEVPHKEEAGTPNIVGTFALCSAIKELVGLNMEKVEKHEKELSEYFLSLAVAQPRIKIYGPRTSEDRVGVFSFTVDGMEHDDVAFHLSEEAAIGVRNGCFCAHPYVLALLQVPQKQALKYQQQILKGNKKGVPGMVRVSFGLYNTKQEISYLFEALKYIINNK